MSTLEEDDVPYVDVEFELVVREDGAAIVRNAPGRGLFAIIEGDVGALTRTLDAIDGERTVGTICRALADRYDRGEIVAIIRRLHEAGHLRIRGDEPAPRSPEPRRVVQVVGSGEMADAIALGLRDRLGLHVHYGGRPLDRAAAETLGEQGNDDVEVSGVADLVICALEGVSYARLKEFERGCVEAGKACLFVTYERGRILIGPTFVPGRTPGFWTTRRALAGQHPAQANDAMDAALEQFTAQALDVDDETRRRLLDRAGGLITDEVARCLADEAMPRLLSSAVIVENDAVAEFALAPEAAPEPSDELEHDLALRADIVLGRLANLVPRAAGPRPTALRTVGIVGGGTAGYLTALALRRKLPMLDVTVVESSKIPIIGVGEATTALLVHFLHSYLGLDVVDFYERVRPTWKLGIRFEWGPPGDYYYNSPFQFGRILEALAYDGDINRSCLASCLMSSDRTSILASRDGDYRSLLSEVPYAYHLDNKRFVRYLQEQATSFGIRHVDTVVTDAVVSENGSRIDHLLTDDGRRLEFDLFVDCSGFRSLLIEKALGSRYLSYASSLFADTAVMADIPNAAGVVRPYTTAETMDNGWCWTIPMEDSDHRGYVFSSAFCSLDQAADEMRRKNPTMGEPWSTRFRSGRHEEFWKGNVVAIGNAYGFVEPLQSTAIHMIIVEIQKMIESFPPESDLDAFQPIVNARVAEVWDHLRWFLAAHYRYNDRLDTAFWQACRATGDVSGIQTLIDLYKERAPIGSTPVRFEELDDSTFGVFRHDLLFMGQQLPTTYAAPEQTRAAWSRITAANDRVVARALDHRSGLRVVREYPDMLHRHVRDLD